MNPPLDLSNLAELAGSPSGCFIGGEWRESRSGATFDVLDPASEQVLRAVSDAGPADGLDALTAASAAQQAFGQTSPRFRADLLRRCYDAVLAQEERFAALIALEMGKPFAESKGEVRYAAEFLRWFSEETERIGGEYRVSADGGARFITSRQPVGPTLLITPWNFPLAMLTRKVGPAIAAGCTSIIKPAEDTPLTALAFVELLSQVGVPDGVINVIPTRSPADLVESVLTDRRLRKLSFTGSTPVGKLLLEQASGSVLRTSMELGGNAPFLVFEDADLESAVAGAMLAKLRNGGQSCVAANRFLVHERVASEFSERLVDAMSDVTVGDAADVRSTLGPLINAKQLDRLSGLVDRALSSGAMARCGGRSPMDRGYFYEPTVLVDVPADSEILAEEIFGPVATISTFRHESEAVSRANATDVGLVSFLYTQDLTRALRVGEALEAGMVGVNRGIVSAAGAPFGGIKQSGLGREGGLEGIGEYLSTKYLAVDMS